MWLAAPRWSAAPHFDGHRSLSAGGRQLCADAVALMVAAIRNEAIPTCAAVRLFMIPPRCTTLFLDAFPDQRALDHRWQQFRRVDAQRHAVRPLKRNHRFRVLPTMFGTLSTST